MPIAGNAAIYIAHHEHECIRRARLGELQLVADALQRGSQFGFGFYRREIQIFVKDITGVIRACAERCKQCNDDEIFNDSHGGGMVAE